MRPADRKWSNLTTTPYTTCSQQSYIVVRKYIHVHDISVTCLSNSTVATSARFLHVRFCAEIPKNDFANCSQVSKYCVNIKTKNNYYWVIFLKQEITMSNGCLRYAASVLKLREVTDVLYKCIIQVYCAADLQLRSTVFDYAFERQSSCINRN